MTMFINYNRISLHQFGWENVNLFVITFIWQFIRNRVATNSTLLINRDVIIRCDCKHRNIYESSISFLLSANKKLVEVNSLVVITKFCKAIIVMSGNYSGPPVKKFKTWKQVPLPFAPCPKSNYASSTRYVILNAGGTLWRVPPHSDSWSLWRFYVCKIKVKQI